MKDEIKKITETIIGQIYPNFNGRQNQGMDISINIPNDKSHGDYSTNIALVLAKKINKNPIETANLIKEKIDNTIFSKVEVAGPGFINFFIADKIFIDILKSIDKDFGRNKELKNKKIAVEYTDPNPFKEFHIGHLMSNSIGEALSRVFEFQGAKVKRFCYQGDVGMHVAKAMWGKLKNPSESWAQSYVFGSREYNENESSKKEITDLNKKIYEKSDGIINKLYEKGKKESLEHFNLAYKRLGTKFDYFIFESQVADIGKKIVLENLEQGTRAPFKKGTRPSTKNTFGAPVFEKGENGAIIFKGEKFGLHTRVFINSEGLPTYEAKELGLSKVKYDKYKYTESLVITGNEVNEYFKVALAALAQIFPKLAGKTKHIGHGMLRLPGGKMGSRTGNVVTAESLIGKVKAMVREKIKDRDLSETEKAETTEAVAIGAIKYSILKQSIGSDIIYDFDTSISFEGDSGPYLQYAYTRAQSVLRKASAEKIKASFKVVPEEVTELEKKISMFEDVVMETGKKYDPHHLVLYLTELAGTFNAYYAKNKIVDKSDKLSAYRVALTGAFSQIMKDGLWMLGIKTLNRM